MNFNHTTRFTAIGAHRFRPVFTWTLAFLVASLTFLDDTTETDGRFSHNKRAASIRGRTTFMSVRPFQFTILQLATLIVGFAIVFACTRSYRGPVFVAFFTVAPALFTKRHREDPGLLGYAIAGVILILGSRSAPLSRRFSTANLSHLGEQPPG